MEPRRPLRPRPDPVRRDLRPRGWLPPRRGRLRRRLLRRLPARGARGGAAAAAAAGGLVGGAGTRRYRPDDAARLRHRRVRRGDRLRLRCRRRRRGDAAAGGIRPDRRDDQHRLRPGGVHVRFRGPDRHRGHRLLVVAGGAAPGRAGAAGRRVRARAGRRRDRDADPAVVRRVLPAACAGGRRPVQGVRRRRGRFRPRRGCRGAAAGTAVGRAPPRPPRPGGRAGIGGELRRYEQPAHRAERAVPAAGDQRRARQRPPQPGRRRRRGSTRHRHHPGRPHRSPSPARHLRPGPPHRPPPATRLGQIQHRPHPGRRRRRGHHQDRGGVAARVAAEDAARGRAVPARRLVHRRGRTAHRDPAMARGQPSPAGGGVLLRDQRHQRPRHPRTGTGTRGEHTRH